MTFNWSQYLTLAKELIGQSPSPASEEAKRRSAISRAYYAAFISARNYLQEREGYSIPKTVDAHKYVREQFKQSADPVRQDIGRKLEMLRKDRNQSDYKNTVSELLRKSKIAVKRSQQVISKLSNL
ncbi:HEPN domain-containing protein [Phormidium nigroviride]